MTDIPDSAVEVILDAMEIGGAGTWTEATRLARAVIDAWEEWEALPTVTVRFEAAGADWWWCCYDNSAHCLASPDMGIGLGYLTEAYAREDAAKHLADIHDGEGRLR